MKKYLILTLLSVVFFNTNAQKTFVNAEYEQAKTKAYALQEEKNYVQAYNEYSKLISIYESIAPQVLSKEKEGVEVADLYFNRALCAYYLMNNDVDMLFKEYKTLFPNSLKKNRADFFIANWYASKADFLMALNTYANMDTSSLTNQERQEYDYKIGYCYFLQNMNDKAKSYFSKVKDTDSKYAAVCKYYYGHILYTEGKYDLALKEFEPLKKNKHFSKVVPYYICQIYYFQGDYDALISMASTLSKNAINSKRATELNRMLGDAYYKKGEYEQALPYIEQSIKSNEGVNRNDNYLMAYCLMETGKNVEAIPYFEACTIEEDALTQNALYSLGYCYLVQGDSSLALNSYNKASTMTYDKTIQEDALFSYAKLCVVNPNPYNETLVKRLNTYIKENTKTDPKTKKTKEGARVGEARICLAQIYGSTHNYAAALEQMEGIKNRDEQLNKIYVKTCLNRGIELFNEEKYKDCIKVLDKIDDNSTSSTNEIVATSKYIKAEALYRTNSYKKSEEMLRSFYAVSGNENNAYKSSADYLMAYNLFKQKKYSLSKEYFTKLEQSEADNTIKNDSKIRIADCQYMLKDYSGAVKTYSSFIQTNSANADYATYQKAMALGAMGEYKTKAQTLKDGINTYTNSSYVPAMTYELANTYLALNDNSNALSNYQSLLKKYPDNAFTKDCLGKVGMLQYQLGQYDQALKSLDKLVRNYPNSKQAKAALSTIKNIYMDKGEPEQYIAYINSLGSVKVSKQEEEDLLYQTAENRYMDEKYSQAITSFKKYLASFPEGNYSTKAEYYLADCYMREKDTLQAGEYYYKVAMKPYGQYTEKSLLNSANIYSSIDTEKALRVYNRLDSITTSSANKLLARKGRMNIYYDVTDYNNAISAANNLLEMENIDQSTKDNAYFVLADSYLNIDKSENAKEYIKELQKSANLKYSSFAQYSLAKIEFDNKNYKESEKIIRQMSKSGADDYYLALGFILWADIFSVNGNDFQAKQTLQSIIDNYDGDDGIKQLATDKLAQLENKNNKEKQDNEDKLNKQENSVDEIIIEDNKY